MTVHRRFWVWVLLGLFATLALDVQAQNACVTGAASATNPLSATARPGSGTGGIGGTGVVAGAPGIGGTGIDPGGIGGTGIVGVITGFASICVNGVEVHFDVSTPVLNAGEPVSARQLAVGQLVAVRAIGTGAEVSARQIAMIDTAVGPLSAVNAATGELRLLGQTVRALDQSDLGQLLVGDWVRVSGHRLAQGEIAASRVQRIDPQLQVQLTGVISRLDGGSLVVAEVPVRIDFPTLSAGLVAGREVTVSGTWDGRVLAARQVVADPTVQALGPASQVVLQGYVHAVGTRQIDLGLGALTLSAQAQLSGASVSSLGINQHVQVTGRMGPDRQITVDRVEISDTRGDGGRGNASQGSGRGGKGAGGRALDRSGERSDRSESSGSSGRSGESDRGSGKQGGTEGSGKEGSGKEGGGKEGGSEGGGRGK